MENWEDVAVPPNTCLLYVDTAQQYKCTVDGKSVTFNLQGTIHSYKFENNVHYLSYICTIVQRATQSNRGELTDVYIWRACQI